jgi:hypothetical protein
MDKQHLSLSEARQINQLSPGNNLFAVGERIRNSLNMGIGFKEEERYYVDGVNGNDNNDGLSWETAFRTITKGVNAARYLPGTTTIDSGKDQHKYVFIWPGQYNEQVLFSGYNIHVIGLTYKIGNVDYGVVINKDGAVTSTAVVGVTGSGIELANLQIYNNSAIPTISMPTPGDGCWVHDCFISGDDSNATYGIQILDCRNSIIENNRIFGHVTAGISVGNGGATWFRNSQIIGNHIAGSAGNGIEVVAATICGAADGSVIGHNYVIGTCAIGIHQANAGAYVLVCDNWIQATAAVTDAGTGSADNHTAS